MPDDGVRDRQQQIASNLRAQILAGDLRPGDRLPSVTALKAQYNVADRTVQRALAILKAERFVRGERGQGVFVTAHQPIVVEAGHYASPVATDEAYAWITENARRGRRGSSELRSVGEVGAPAQVAAAYGIEPGTPVVLRHQLLLLDDEPAELVWSYYLLDVARGTPLEAPRKIRGGTSRLLPELGHPLRHAVDHVGTRLATVDEFTALRLPDDMPVLRQFRVVFTDGDRPVEVTIMIKAGQQYELRYVLPGPIS